MFKIKEVPTSEVHRVMRWNAKEQANDTGKPQLGPTLSRHFADVKVATNSYVWSHAESGWQSLSGTSAEKRPAIEVARDNLFAQVRSKLAGSQTATPEDFLTYPNDDYVFYKLRDDGTIDILLTGWGFRNQKQVTGEIIRVTTDKTDKQDVVFSFLNNGTPVPNRPFYVTTNQNLNREETDAEGNYRLNALPVGKEVQITDEVTHRTFPLKVEKGRTIYTFDVTRRADICVKVRENGQPVAGESVTLTYGDTTLTETTNATGEAHFSLLCRDTDDNATVAVRDQQQQTVPDEHTAPVIFDFATPVEPEEPVTEEPEKPKEQPTINVSFRDAGDKPFAGANVVFRQGEKQLPLTLDETGTTHFPADTFTAGKPVEALLTTPTHKYPAIPFTIDPAECDYLLREVASRRPWWYTLLFILAILALIVIFFYIGLCFNMSIVELHNYFQI